MTDSRIFRFACSPQRQSSALLLFGIFAILTGADPVFARQLQHVQGTSVSLEPMPGFEPTTSFAGFMNPNQGSILIVEMPEAAYSSLSQGLGNIEAARNNFAKSNIVVDRLETISAADGGKAPLIAGSQSSGQASYDKWVAIFKGPPTVIVTVTSPRANRLTSAQVRAMMESVSIGRQPTLADKVTALPFSATPAAPFRILDSLAGATLSMTVGDKDVDPEGTQPFLMIAYEPTLVDDPVELERNPKPPRSLGTPLIDSRKSVEFAGINGVLFVGRCDGNRRFLQYMAVTAEKKLITLVYVAPEAGFDGLRPAAEAIAGSVALKSN